MDERIHFSLIYRMHIWKLLRLKPVCICKRKLSKLLRRKKKNDRRKTSRPPLMTCTLCIIIYYLLSCTVWANWRDNLKKVKRFCFKPLNGRLSICRSWRGGERCSSRGRPRMTTKKSMVWSRGVSNPVSSHRHWNDMPIYQNMEWWSCTGILQPFFCTCPALHPSDHNGART